MTNLKQIMPEPQQRLLDEFQRDFPLVPRPYAQLGEQLDLSEAEVIQMLSELQESGEISRIGPVFAPNRLGCSTLAALAVPETELEQVAGLINGYKEVNHNYEREHKYNLWFVITAESRGEIDRVLADITLRTGLEPLDLPMIKEYFIDLGFRLWSGQAS